MAGRTRLGWLLVGLVLLAPGIGVGANTWNVNPGDDIQGVINSAAAGDTVVFAPGTYNLNATINVTKPLTILGAQANVDPRPSTGGRTGPETLLTSNTTVFDIQAHNVVINGFSIQANINHSGTNIIHDNNPSFVSENATVAYNIITNAGSTMNEAVKIRGGSAPVIAYNYIYDIPSPGDAINFDRVTNGRIEYNEIFNSGSENAAIYIYDSEYTWIVGNLVDTTTKNDGIKLGRKSTGNPTLSGGWIIGNVVTNTAQDGITVYTSNVIVEGNTVTGATTENGAIYLAFGISNIVIRYNTIVDNTLNPHKWGTPGGITIGSAVNASTVQIYGNTIMGNYPVDVANMASGAPLLDATGNWWGQDTGPLPGQIAGNVAYSPWLGNDPSEPVWTFVVAQAGPQLPAGYLQTGLDIARDGDVVFVTAGEYVTQGLIEKSLVLLGEPGAVIKAPGSQTYTIAESSRTLDPIIFAYGGTMVGSHVSGSGVISADVKGLVIDGQNKAQAHPIRFVGILYRNVHGEISGNVIQNMMNPGGGGGGAETFGILVYGDSVVDILNNMVSGFSRGGIGIMGDMGLAPDPVANVSGNVVIGNGLEAATGWWAENGIQIGYGATGVISGNLVTQCWVNNPAWTATGILVVSTDNVVVEGNTVVLNESGIGIAGYGAWGWPSSNDNVVRGNDVIGNMWGIDIQMDANNTLVIYNNIAGNTGAGVSVAQFYGYEPAGTVIRFNSIVGNAVGVANYGVSTGIDAALNWWGSVEGPTAATNPGGNGDAVYGDVIYSPWLGTDPDGDPAQPGVQITGPVLIIVAPVGPEPTGGYLNTAITGANTLPHADTIEVRHGTYDASEPITGPVTLISQVGSASHTTLTGPMSLRSGGILIGLPLRGFTIIGDVTVEELVDAASSRINWSNLYGTVTNKGTGTFDARYNYWGTQVYAVIDARTIGDIAVDPYLPRNADDSYRDIVALFTAGVAGDLDRAIDQLWAMARLGQDVNTFVQYLGVAGAGALGGPPPGAQIGAGFAGTILEEEVAGGAAGLDFVVDGAVVVGDAIGGHFTLTDPVTGQPIAKAVVTLSLLGEDGKLAFWGAATYDPTTGEYVFSIDTSGLAPGTYQLIIQAVDGQSATLTIEILEA